MTGHAGMVRWVLDLVSMQDALREELRAIHSKEWWFLMFQLC
jgi:hypothetical protein